MRVLWSETSKTNPAEDCAQRAVEHGVDVLMVSGGDGTVMACARALMGTAIPLGILPGGTGNIVATSLRLPTHVGDSIETALYGIRRRIDLGVSGDGSPFFAASLGFSAVVMRDATTALKARIGMLAYALTAIRHLQDPPRTFSVRLDDGSPIVRLSHAVLVGNFGELMTKPRLPRTALDDGRLEIGILRIRPLLAWTRRDVPALHVEPRPPLDWYQAERVEITCERSQPTERDGEYTGMSSRLEIRALPRSLEVCVPASTALSAPRRSLSHLVTGDVRALFPYIWRRTP